MSETLFESELFGHEKGAFADAREERIGKFETAQESTLFGDEIANLPLPLQAKLLAALQNREITRLGSNRKIKIDIRLMAHAWPGNVRELQYCIERAVILVEGSLVKAGDILVRPGSAYVPPEIVTLEEIERQVIETTIQRNNGNLSATAKQLGIRRQTLYNKMKRYFL